jgi:hypothetical protein
VQLRDLFLVMFWNLVGVIVGSAAMMLAAITEIFIPGWMTFFVSGIVFIMASLAVWWSSQDSGPNRRRAAGAITAGAAVATMGVAWMVINLVSYRMPAPAPPDPLNEIVKQLAKPARVDFKIEPAETVQRPLEIPLVKMRMGEVYEARLEILRPSAKPVIDSKQQSAIAVDVQIMDRVAASLESGVVTITRSRNDEWQEIPDGGRGFWVWKLEPQRPGTGRLYLTLQHAVLLDKERTRVFNVDFFPHAIEIEIGWWHRVSTFFAGISPTADAIAKVIGAVVAACGAGYGLHVWLRKRRRLRRQRERMMAKASEETTDHAATHN